MDCLVASAANKVRFCFDFRNRNLDYFGEIMNVVFRADASSQIGLGHVMRSLTLAEELRMKGADVYFICRELPGHACQYLESKNIPLFSLSFPGDGENLSGNYNEKSVGSAFLKKFERNCYTGWLGVIWEQDAQEVRQILSQEFAEKNKKIDWLVVDHYALDRRWEEQMRPFVKKIMVIDDLADRPHDCDLLLDQNLYENMKSRYDGLVPEHCIKLLGPNYALLRREFREARANLRERDGTVKRILVFFGGSDSYNETAKALEAIQMLGRPDIAIDVVVGLSNPHKDQIKEMCSILPNTKYYCQVDNMAELMAQADLAIGAGGSATWERCFLGLPSITIITAKNQRESALAVSSRKATYNLGVHDQVSSKDIFEILQLFLSSGEILQDMGRSAFEILGKKVCEKSVIIKYILGRK